MNSSNSASARSAPRPTPPPEPAVEMMLDGVWVTTGSHLTRRVLRQDRSAERKMTREARRISFARLHAELEDAAIVRRMLVEAREAECAHRRFHARLRLKGDPKRQARVAAKPKRELPLRPSRLPKMLRIPIDSQGRIGVYYKQGYVRAGGKGGSPGCARRGWVYIARDGAVLTDHAGNPIIISNMGESFDEIAEAWEVSEHAARATRKNAKIQFRLVLALDADASQKEMVAAVKGFTELAFGHLDVPHSAVVHRPPPDGDQRNWHAHVLFSLRPMTVAADGGWDVADDLVSDLDGKDGVRLLRHLWAHAMSEAARGAGREAEYTGLSYAARGLDLDSQEHLGPMRADMVARGEHVPAHARNMHIAAMNDLRLERRELLRQQEALLALRDAVLARERRTQLSAIAYAPVVRHVELVPPSQPVVRKPASRLLDVEPFNGRPRRAARVSVPAPKTLLGLPIRADPSRRVLEPATSLISQYGHQVARTVEVRKMTSPTELGLSVAPPRLAPAAAEIASPQRGPAGSIRQGATVTITVRSTLASSPRRGEVRLHPVIVTPPPVRDAPHPYTISEVAASPKRAAGRTRILSATTPAYEPPSWRREVERYLHHLRLRQLEDQRSRKRLAGYAVLPPEYLKAVQDVEANPRLLVERDSRSRVADGVALERARAIQAVIDDPNWREFLRRVRAVGLEIAARAILPLGSFADLPERPNVPEPQRPGGRQHGKSRKKGRGVRRS
jgi:hypothetical protein